MGAHLERETDAARPCAGRGRQRVGRRLQGFDPGGGGGAHLSDSATPYRTPVRLAFRDLSARRPMEERVSNVLPGDADQTIGSYDDTVEGVLHSLASQRESLLAEIERATKVKLEAMAEVRQARADLETVERLLNAATKRTRPKKPAAVTPEE